MTLNEAIQIMTNEIVTVLADNKPTIYLFGSVALDDFQLGWVILTSLFLLIANHGNNRRKHWWGLRRALLERIDSSYFLLFEGGMLSADAFLQDNKKERSIGERAVSESPTVIKWIASAWQNCSTEAYCCMEKTFAVK